MIDFICHALMGIVLFIGFAAYRAVTSGEWDDSNITNWFRVFVHLALHPGDFFYMYYVTRDSSGKPITARKVFWYLNKDEITEVVDTRPRLGERR